MIVLKLCARCHGDMMLEEMLGETELVCFQCGYRVAAIQTKLVPQAVPVRLRNAAMVAARKDCTT